MTHRRLLGVADAAAYLGVSARAVWRLLGQGALQRVELPGTRRVLLDVEDLNALVEASKHGPAVPGKLFVAPGVRNYR